jgi:Bacterial Ig-like domain
VRPSLSAGDDPVRVLRMDPTDGATGVFCDTPIVASLSHPLQASSVTAEAFAVEDEAGAVPGEPALTPDGRCVVWRPARLLVPGVAHRVRVAGLRDVRGRTMAPHQSRFVPCDLTFRDVFD